MLRLCYAPTRGESARGHKMDDGQLIGVGVVAALAVPLIAALARTLYINLRDDSHDHLSEEELAASVRNEAKRFNEGVKLFATFLNNLAIGTSVTLIGAPAINQGTVGWITALIALLVALLLHMFGQLALRLYKDES